MNAFTTAPVTSSICASHVTFGDDEQPTCWAHTADRRFCDGTQDCLHHGCNDHDTGRLGLCRYHEREILG